MEVRLQTHLSSYASKPGDRIRAVVIAPVRRGGKILIPRDSIIYGHVVNVDRVGHGLVRERAALQVDFDLWEDPEGNRHKFESQLIEIDNARERVLKDGKVQGILAAGGAPGFLLGLWRRPQVGLLARTAGGFAGVSRFVLDKTPGTPVGIAGVIALRFLAVRWPEPEIHYAPGTDLLLALRTLPPARADEPAPDAAPESLISFAAEQPFQTTRTNVEKEADITNFFFFGTAQQVERAFLAAGWNPAEPLTARSRLRTYNAISAQRGYPTAPMSTLLLEGREPDMTFQKNLNSIARRHHIRIWKLAASYEGQEVWTGAATHDTGVKLQVGGMFTHQTDPQIDRERRKVLDDLLFAGCVERARMVAREGVTHADLKDTVTDGRLAAVTLQACEPKAMASWEAYPSPPLAGHRGMLLARRLVLEGRYAVTRGNIYYWSYRGGREGIAWLRNKLSSGSSRLLIHSWRPLD